MKVTKILALALALIMVVSVFAACGKKETPTDTSTDTTPTPVTPVTYSTIYSKPSYALSATAEKMEFVSELDGYTISNSFTHGSNSEFLVFVKADTYNTYKIFSLRNGKVVLTFTNEQNITYVPYITSNLCTFFVEKAEAIYENGILSKTKYSTIMYDACGTAVVTKDNKRVNEVANYSVRSLLWYIIYDNKTMYAVDYKTGSLTKQTDIYSYMNIPTNILGYTSNHIFVMDTSNDGFIVLDHSLNFVSSWEKPTQASDFNLHLLNDGNALIQYQKELSPDATDYDIYEGSTATAMKKYDLVTLRYNAATGATSEFDFDYSISMITSYESLKLMGKRFGIDYASIMGTFENLAVLYPIEDKKINTNESDTMHVMMDNDAKLGQSLLLADNQTSQYINKISDSVYRVSTTYGSALVDASGNVIKQITGTLSAELIGEYLYDGESKKIYDDKLSVLYDLEEKNAEFLTYIDNTIYVAEYAPEDVSKTGNYKVLAFITRGSGSEIANINTSAEYNTVFRVLNNTDVYYLYNENTKIATYYSSVGGTALATLDLNKITIDSSSAISYGAFTLFTCTDSTSGTTATRYLLVNNGADLM